MVAVDYTKKRNDEHIFTEKCAKTKPSSPPVVNTYLVNNTPGTFPGENVPRTH